MSQKVDGIISSLSELESDIDLSFKVASKNKNGLSYGVIGTQSSVSNNILFQNDNKVYQSIFRFSSSFYF